MIGPRDFQGINAGVLSTRHNNKGHLLFCDFHIERVNAKVGLQLERSKRFWLPAATTDPVPLNITAGLPDP
jgi:prepilin-type processing-associated H-X9-DG protein